MGRRPVAAAEIEKQNREKTYNTGGDDEAGEGRRHSQ
jgi:hypothetical protein